MGIKDKTDTRYVRVRAPSQLIFVAQAAEFNRTQIIVFYDFIYASKLLSIESLSESKTVNYSTSSKKTSKYAESKYGFRALKMIFHRLLFITISMLLSTEFRILLMPQRLNRKFVRYGIWPWPSPSNFVILVSTFQKFDWNVWFREYCW